MRENRPLHNTLTTGLVPRREHCVLALAMYRTLGRHGSQTTGVVSGPKPGQRYREIEKQFPTASRPGNAGNVKVGKRGRG